MKPSNVCLPKSEIPLLLSGDLPPEEVTAAENHLAECATCRSEIESMIADSRWWDDAQHSLRESRGNLLAEGRESSSDSLPDDSPDSSCSAANILELLGPTDDPAMLGRIGVYEITGVLGQGGMGVVFKGYDGSLNRFVAIKMLRPHLAASGASRKRFAREAQAAAAVVDDHVMAIHGVSEWKSVPYFVMPYSRGVSLQRRLSNNGPLEVREVLRIGMQAANGLAAAHSQGLVHRDVKPANIFLDEGVERVQLMDFGLARAVDDASLTRSGTLAGTPQYMSPEQARAETVDHRSDLFSLGSVLYAMCTGHAPFRAESSYSVLRLITDKEPRSIREINPDVPEWLENIVMKLLSKSRKNRFDSAEQVAELLEDCLAHVQHPTTTPLPTSISALSTSRRRRWILVCRMRTYFGLKPERENNVLNSTYVRRRLAAVFSLAMLLTLGMVGWANRSKNTSYLLPSNFLTSDLRSEFQTSPNLNPLFTPGLDSVDDATQILEKMSQFWKGVNSFRVKQSRTQRGSHHLTHSVLVGERPNKLMLRYMNWSDGRAMVCNGDTVRIGLESAISSPSPKKQFYLEGTAPETLSTFLEQSHLIGSAPGIRAYADEELLALLPFIEDPMEFWLSRGWQGFRLNGIEQILVSDGYRVSAYHLEGFRAGEVEGDSPHLWIASEGAPLLLKVAYPNTPFEFATYAKWVLNPKLPQDGVFNLPPTLGYDSIDLKFIPRNSLGKPQSGTPAPELKMQLLDGSTRMLSDFRGQVCVLDFWATWCGPCLNGLPVVQRVCDEFSEQGVELFAVTSEKDIAKIREVVRSHDLGSTIALDVDGQSSEFGVRAVPHLVIVDRKGVIRVSHSGYLPSLADDLRSELGRLVGL